MSQLKPLKRFLENKMIQSNVHSEYQVHLILILTDILVVRINLLSLQRLQEIQGLQFPILLKQAILKEVDYFQGH